MMGGSIWYLWRVLFVITRATVFFTLKLENFYFKNQNFDFFLPYKTQNFDFFWPNKSQNLTYNSKMLT